MTIESVAMLKNDRKKSLDIDREQAAAATSSYYYFQNIKYTDKVTKMICVHSSNKEYFASC